MKYWFCGEDEHFVRFREHLPSLREKDFQLMAKSISEPSCVLTNQIQIDHVFDLVLWALEQNLFDSPTQLKIAIVEPSVSLAHVQLLSGLPVFHIVKDTSSIESLLKSDNTVENHWRRVWNLRHQETYEQIRKQLVEIFQNSGRVFPLALNLWLAYQQKRYDEIDKLYPYVNQFFAGSIWHHYFHCLNQIKELDPKAAWHHIIHAPFGINARLSFIKAFLNLHSHTGLIDSYAQWLYKHQLTMPLVSYSFLRELSEPLLSESNHCRFALANLFNGFSIDSVLPKNKLEAIALLSWIYPKNNSLLNKLQHILASWNYPLTERETAILKLLANQNMTSALLAPYQEIIDFYERQHTHSNRMAK